MVPAIIFLYFFSRELVYLIFERGSFDAFAGDNTSLALSCYLVGLPSYGFYKVFVLLFMQLIKRSCLLLFLFFVLLSMWFFALLLHLFTAFIFWHLVPVTTLILNLFFKYVSLIAKSNWLAFLSQQGFFG